MIKFSGSIVLVALLSVTPSQTVADTVYRSVDANGVVEFSDQRREKSEAINIQPLPIVGSTPLPGAIEQPKGRSSVAERYRSIRINSPKSNETFNNVNTIPVNIITEPSLALKHRVQLKMNGTIIGPIGRQLSRSIFLEERGSYELIAEIIDENNRIILQSAPTTFYLKRYSRLFGQQPGRAPNAITQPAAP